MVTLLHPVLGVGDVERAVAFWAALLDYRPREPSRTPRWCTLGPGDGAGGPLLALQRSTAPVEAFPRVHLDLAVRGRAELERLACRAVELGGERVDWPLYPADPDFVVLADTEGNRFCVVDLEHDRSAMMMDGGRPT